MRHFQHQTMIQGHSGPADKLISMKIHQQWFNLKVLVMRCHEDVTILRDQTSFGIPSETVQVWYDFCD